MNIQINDYIRITSDRYNVIIEGRRDRKPDEKSPETFTTWNALSYHPDLESACIALQRSQERMSEARSIDELIKEVRVAKDAIIEAVRATGIKREFAEIP